MPYLTTLGLLKVQNLKKGKISQCVGLNIRPEDF